MEMASSKEKKNPHRRGKKEVMNMELYDDYSILAELGWQAAEQPWSSSTALQYVKLAFLDRMWPRECHAKNIETKSASWCDFVDIEVKWRFLTILRAISNTDYYARNIIPVSIVSLMNAEHVLRVPVDWSTLPSTGFGYLLKIYLTRKFNLLTWLSQIGSGTIQLFWTTQNLQFQPIANRGRGQDLVKADEFLPTMSWTEILELYLPK
jgi:hypothetical protein